MAPSRHLQRIPRETLPSYLSDVQINLNREQAAISSRRGIARAARQLIREPAFQWLAELKSAADPINHDWHKHKGYRAP